MLMYAKPNATCCICSAPANPSIDLCPPCMNETGDTQFWGFVSCIINFESLINGSDTRVVYLQEMVSGLGGWVGGWNGQTSRQTWAISWRGLNGKWHLSESISVFHVHRYVLVLQ